MPMTPTEGLAICARAPTPVSRCIRRQGWRQQACTECLGSSPVGSTASLYMQLRCRHEYPIAIQPKMLNQLELVAVRRHRRSCKIEGAVACLRTFWKTQ